MAMNFFTGCVCVCVTVCVCVGGGGGPGPLGPQSALYKFGWSVGGSIQNTQGGHFRRGHRIPINAKGAGRRRGKSSKGKGKALSGRPKGEHSSFTMKPRKEPRGKRMHSLKSCIEKGTQNAGKW